MAKSRNLKDSERYKIVLEEVQQFNKLVKGHKKLLAAIGEL